MCTSSYIYLPDCCLHCRVVAASLEGPVGGIYKFSFNYICPKRNICVNSCENLSSWCMIVFSFALCRIPTRAPLNSSRLLPLHLARGTVLRQHRLVLPRLVCHKSQTSSKYAARGLTACFSHYSSQTDLCIAVARHASL